MKPTFFAAVAAALFATAASAESIIEIVDPYVLSAGMNAKSGAAFFTIRNTGDTDDRLIDAKSDAAARVELHTHIMEDGIAKMRQVEDGFPIPAGSEHLLMRGADHVMFMGLNEPFVDGKMVAVTLVFESGLTLDVEIPVDLGRANNAEANGHGSMDHGKN
ncbi:copper chaperone PCu(A)C [Marivivens sp. LCG002]|uniref:copper chaperone PCu(A)C n=1 Tax=Marivivens sp. LCG002 TaxID=3051171 RepID=UPI002552BDD2|nr:copper chaperone PCu(A)C [Marivivens sp. LCG002]WIV50132.1 copper chaperone PCu(A)C [Marivivens sp. LCG002]